MSKEQTLLRLDAMAYQVMARRDRSLLVLYYPGDEGNMLMEDAPEAYNQLRQAQVSKESKLDKLDVLLHTYGGDPNAAYQLGQTIRSLAIDVDFVIPEYAHSAGSLLALSGDCIWFGDNASLSPFDITLTEDAVPKSKVVLASVDNYLEFATEARRKVETMMRETGSNGVTTIDSDLVCELVKQVGALKIGEYYRERLLVSVYAQVFLDRYMFREVSDGPSRRKSVIRTMAHVSPSHDFLMDFCIAESEGLIVQQLDTDTSDQVKAMVAYMDELTEQDVICEWISGEERVPLIRFFDINSVPEGVRDDYIESPSASGTNPSDGHFDGPSRDVQAEADTAEASRQSNVEGEADQGE